MCLERDENHCDCARVVVVVVAGVVVRVGQVIAIAAIVVAAQRKATALTRTTIVITPGILEAIFPEVSLMSRKSTLRIRTIIATLVLVVVTIATVPWKSWARAAA